MIPGTQPVSVPNLYEGTAQVHFCLQFPNAIRWIWLYPGQDSQEAQPGHSSAPAGPQGELREDLSHIWVRGTSLPCCSLFHQHHSSDAVRGSEPPWDPIPLSSCASDPNIWKGLSAPQPHAVLYSKEWHLSCPINCAQESLEMNANLGYHKRGKGVKRSPVRVIHLQESLINAHSQA